MLMLRSYFGPVVCEPQSATTIGSSARAWEVSERRSIEWLVRSLVLLRIWEQHEPLVECPRWIREKMIMKAGLQLVQRHMMNHPEL